MEGFLDFARGPLFRLTFALMVLGLLRILVLDIWGLYEAHRKAGDRKMPWGLAISRSLEWLFPIKRLGHRRPLYSVVAILFHIGLILVPLFLFAHVQLWKGAFGFGWFTLSKTVADILTIVTIAGGIGILAGRVFVRESRFISRKQDFLWPVVLVIPFITGFVCANLGVSPQLYQILMLIHVLCGELIFLLLPFSKLAHCVIMPLSQFVMVVAWHFPANTDEDVCITLGKKGAKV